MRNNALFLRRILFFRSVCNDSYRQKQHASALAYKSRRRGRTGKRVAAEVPDAWWCWHVIHFSHNSSIIDLFCHCSRMMKVSSFLSLVLSFASIVSITNADDKSTTLDILMPDAVASHVRSLVCRTYQKMHGSGLGRRLFMCVV